MDRHYMYYIVFNSCVPSSSHFHFAHFHSSFFTLRTHFSIFIIHYRSFSHLTFAPLLHRHRHRSFASVQRPLRHLLLARLSSASCQHLHTLPGRPHASNTFSQRQTSFSPHLTTASEHLLPLHHKSCCHPRRTAPATPLQKISIFRVQDLNFFNKYLNVCVDQLIVQGLWILHLMGI